SSRYAFVVSRACLSLPMTWLDAGSHPGSAAKGGPNGARSFVGRFAARAGFVTARQRFVRCCHGTEAAMERKGPRPLTCRGKLSRAGGRLFGPSRSATNWRDCRAEHPSVALLTAGDLFIYAKYLFVEAIDGKGPSRWRPGQVGRTDRSRIRPFPPCLHRVDAEYFLVALSTSEGLFICAKDLFVPAMVTTDGRQELRRRLICCLVVQLDGMREIIRRKRPQRLSHGRLRKLTGKFSASCGQFFVVVRS